MGHKVKCHALWRSFLDACRLGARLHGFIQCIGWAATRAQFLPHVVLAAFDRNQCPGPGALFGSEEQRVGMLRLFISRGYWGLMTR